MPSVDVLFKKGRLAELPASGDSSVVEGALYFAINDADASNQRGKLFLGDASHKLIPIGEDITLKTIQTLNQLPSASNHADEFYYCVTGNILAHSNGTDWVQINSAARLKEDAQNIDVTVSNNVATIDDLIEDEMPGGTGKVSQGNFKLIGDTNVALTAGTGTNEIKIAAKDTTYDLAATSAGTDPTAEDPDRSLGVNINLSGAISGATGTVATDTVKIKSTDSVVAELNANGEIELTVDTSGVGSVTGAHIAGGQTDADHDGRADQTDASLEGFHIAVSSTTDTFADNINPGISIKGASGAVESTVKFVSSAYDSDTPVAALDVYSTSAIETKLTELRNTINAMTYRGMASTISQVTNPSGGLHNGDVFLAGAEINFHSPTNYQTEGIGLLDEEGKENAQPGYLIVVSGTENSTGVIADPTTAKYTIVKANDTDTTYSVVGTEKRWAINEAGDEIGAITFAEGTAITVADSAPTSDTKTITVGHANVAHTDTTGAAVNPTPTAGNNGELTQTFNAVTGVTVNAQGHVTDVTTSPVTVTSHILKQADTAAEVVVTGTSVESGYTAAITTTVADTSGASVDAAYSLQSNSLELAEPSSNVISINLVWGTFGTNQF